MKSTPKKILSLFMSLLMLLSVTSGLTFTSFADDANADVSFEYTENDDGRLSRLRLKFLHSVTSRKL